MSRLETNSCLTVLRGKNKVKLQTSIIFDLYLEIGGKTLWSRKWQLTPVFLSGKSHGWKSLAACGPWGCKESDMTERLGTGIHHCTWFVRNETDFPLRPSRRSINSVNGSTTASCHIVSMLSVYSEITHVPANIPRKGCYITDSFEFFSGRMEKSNLEQVIFPI